MTTHHTSLTTRTARRLALPVIAAAGGTIDGRSIQASGNLSDDYTGVICR